MTTATVPGYRVLDAVPAPAEEGLRNDVAAFLGSAVRGPLGVPVRVTSRQAYRRVFGDATRGTLPRALAAFFANGGEVAWVVRAGTGGTASSAVLRLADEDRPGALSGLPWAGLELRASSPGTWADGTVVSLTVRAHGPVGGPSLDLVLEVPGEAPLRRAGLGPAQVVAELAAPGHLMVRPLPQPDPDAGDDEGPRGRVPAVRTRSVTLTGGGEPSLDVQALSAAVAAQGDLEDVALVCVPELAGRDPDEQDRLLVELAATCARGQDRLAVVTVRCAEVAAATAWAAHAAALLAEPSRQRAVAAYAGWLRAAALGPQADPYPVTDPVGHVCGVIARTDRERGSGWSPANLLVADAVDVADPLAPVVQGSLLDRGLNLLRPRTGGGLEVWGARTLDPGEGRHVAHRRLVHRIVRAVRRVCEPLVFDTDDALLRFTCARAVSGVLMEAFRSGALAGETPDEAYRVRCDETTTTPEDAAAGRVVCEVEVAPATPMEFIVLRLVIGSEGLLEVVER